MQNGLGQMGTAMLLSGLMGGGDPNAYTGKGYFPKGGAKGGTNNSEEICRSFVREGRCS